MMSNCDSIRVPSQEHLTSRGHSLRPADLVTLGGLGDLTAYLPRCRVATFECGDVLISEGEMSPYMYIVLEGFFDVRLGSAEGTRVATLAAGDTVGELSLLDAQATSAWVIARESSRVLAVDADTFWAWARSSHQFCTAIMVKLARRIRNTNSTVSDNVSQRQRFEKVALYDALTSVHNRRWLDETLPRLVQRHEHLREPLSVAIVDVDYFKRINDTYGHAVGDAVLVALAREMRNHLRPTDMLARYGGEEFVVILPDAHAAGAFSAAERLRRAVEAMVVDCDGLDGTLGITISLGVATAETTKTAAQLLSDADLNLYAAKRAGRNRTMPSME